MNTYRWEEISIGMEEHFTVVITEKMLDGFKEITGDSNPLHQSREFAREKGYTDRVGYGMLTASFLSTLAGVYLPGERSLIHSVETKFLKPVYVGDELTISGKVSEMDERFQILKLKVTITNQKSEKVCKGTMQIGIL